MSLLETFEQNTQSHAIALIDDWIVHIVNERIGIKDTELLTDIIRDIAECEDHDPLVYGDCNIEMISSEIHRMMYTGRIIGVDCQIGDTGHTYLLPANTNVIMSTSTSRTRH